VLVAQGVAGAVNFGVSEERPEAGGAISAGCAKTLFGDRGLETIRHRRD